MQVYVFNFNPSFVKSSENEYYDIQRYSSEIQVNDYPGDILSSKYEKSNKVRTRYWLFALVNVLVTVNKQTPENVNPMPVQ